MVMYEGMGFGTKYFKSANELIVKNPLGNHENENANTLEGFVKGSDALSKIQENLKNGEYVAGLPSSLMMSCAGAISTASHGNIGKNGTLSNSLDEIEIHSPSLGLIHLNKHDDFFNAATVGLGVLGYITKMKFRFQKSKRLIKSVRAIELDKFLNELPSILKNSEGVVLQIFNQKRLILTTFSKSIQTDNFDLNKTSLKKIYDIGENLGVKLQRRMSSKQKSFLRYEFTKYFPQQYLIPAKEAHLPMSSYSANSKFMNKVNINSHEISIALTEIDSFLRLLMKDWSETWINTLSSNPITIRFTGSDVAFLSPSFGRDSVWIDFLTDKDDGLGILEKIENWHLSSGINARPHWGKFFTPEKYIFSDLYENFEKFNDIRMTMDSAFSLKNSFANRIFRS
jgi:hypothetical protein